MAWCGPDKEIVERDETDREVRRRSEGWEKEAMWRG